MRKVKKCKADINGRHSWNRETIAWNQYNVVNEYTCQKCGIKVQETNYVKR